MCNRRSAYRCRKPQPSEQKDIVPFFKSHKHLVEMVGAYNAKLHRFDRIATEFSLFGDYACDLVVGDFTTHLP